jgi:hypothetical protein
MYGKNTVYLGFSTMCSFGHLETYSLCGQDCYKNPQALPCACSLGGELDQIPADLSGAVSKGSFSSAPLHKASVDLFHFLFWGCTVIIIGAQTGELTSGSCSWKQGDQCACVLPLPDLPGLTAPPPAFSTGDLHSSCSSLCCFYHPKALGWPCHGLIPWPSCHLTVPSHAENHIPEESLGLVFPRLKLRKNLPIDVCLLCPQQHSDLRLHSGNSHVTEQPVVSQWQAGVG